ncbi:hypothetical protein INS49_010832 [Diaporthe citri]|uniref:uncharacterized protein n=1 Tax=Diaporthe citri TaxID=83186 RepID=UPI001C7EF2DB|nr:uncharacterized protein INS49_010832 [Diaporthe citri]KAG6359780.1 hypothetical protein INS49_010832 [Diaporthe citri]
MGSNPSDTLVANFEPRGKFFKGMTDMPLSFIKNLGYVLGEVTSFAFTRAASQALSEQILAEVRHFHRLKKLLVVVWDNVCALQPLLETLSASVNRSLEELCLIIEVSDPSIPFLEFSQIQRILSPSLRGLRRLVVSCRRTHFYRATARPQPSAGPNPNLQSAVAYANVFPDLEVVRLWGHLIDIVRGEDGVHAEFSTKQFDFPFLGDFDTLDEHRMWE